MDTRPPLLVFGCGYLGLRAARLWRAAGGPVFALTRGRADQLRSEGVTPVAGDVCDPATLGSLPPAGVVLYAVGFDRSAGRDFRDVYVGGLANVLDALPPGGRFLYVSSTGVYAQQGGEDVDEDAPTEPADGSGRTVLEAERLLRSRRPDAVVLRFSGIYGPGRLMREAALRAGEPLAVDPDKLLNLIHVEDGAAAVLAAADRAAGGATYNVSDDRPVVRRDFYAELARVLAAPPPRFAPPPADAPAAGRHDRTNRRISNRRMRRELGVELAYPTYAEGLSASVSRASASR